MQEKYITSLVANVDVRFASSSSLLAALKIFDPLVVPETSELGFVYRNMDIVTLAEHFYQADNNSQEKRSSKLLAEWNQMKFNKPNIPTEIKTRESNTTSTQWFLSHVMKSKSEYQLFFGELLFIAEAAITLPVEWPERRASALTTVKTRSRSSLQNDILEAMLHVKVNGPGMERPKMESLVKESVETWLSKKNKGLKVVFKLRY